MTRGCANTSSNGSSCIVASARCCPLDGPQGTSRGFTLRHAVEHFETALDQDSRHELDSVIQNYRKGLIPIIVPLTLIRHHARRLKVTYLLEQRYLDPELKELMLRNHV